MEAAAEMIVHSAGRHFAQGEQRHLRARACRCRIRAITRVNAEQKIQRDRARKFRRAAEAAFVRIEAARDLLVSGVESFRAELAAGIARLPATACSKRGDDLRSLL